MDLPARRLVDRWRSRLCAGGVTTSEIVAQSHKVGPRARVRAGAGGTLKRHGGRQPTRALGPALAGPALLLPRPARHRGDRVQAQVRRLRARLRLVAGEAARALLRALRRLRPLLQAHRRLRALPPLPADRDRALDVLRRRDHGRDAVRRRARLAAAQARVPAAAVPAAATRHRRDDASSSTRSRSAPSWPGTGSRPTWTGCCCRSLFLELYVFALGVSLLLARSSCASATSGQVWELVAQLHVLGLADHLPGRLPAARGSSRSSSSTRSCR